MSDAEKERSREKLNDDLKPTLDKEELRDLDRTKGEQEQVRGGACEMRSCWVSCVYTK